jgi:hypothetical protein
VDDLLFDRRYLEIVPICFNCYIPRCINDYAYSLGLEAFKYFYV